MDDFNTFLLCEIVETASSLTSSSSSSSSENEELRCNANRIKNYMEVVSSYSEKEFKEHIRLYRATVKLLIDSYATNIRPYKGGWAPVSEDKAVYMLKFRQLADRFDVTTSCAHNTIKSVSDHLISMSKIYIKWPTENEALEESLSFERRKGLKEIVGAIDGSHIRIHRPTQHEEDYVNRKGYHSILLQATVNSKMLFIDVMVGEPGSVHDARMLRKSSIYKIATEDPNRLFYGKYALLGDSAYPSLPWLIPPFKNNGHLTEEQRQFNYNHSSTRIVVANSFGLLKGRFRRLRSFENIDIRLINKLVISAYVLHNICILANDTSDESFIEDVA